jgi:Fe2+ transport system protein FeoA
MVDIEGYFLQLKEGVFMQVSQLKVGDEARVVGVGPGNGAYRQRLIAMGLIPGTPFKVVRMAPLGDPIEILVRGYALSLRKTEANILQIEEAAS